MRAALEEVYRYVLEKLKSRLAAHKGRFALTLDEWKSSNNYEFLAVTFNFHNDDFELEKFVIEFKILNDDLLYTGEVLYGHLNRVLNEYDIKDRMNFITRDNAVPINTLIDKFKESFNQNDTGLEFSGDIRCAGHVLNLTTNAFLACTYFKASISKILLKPLETTRESYPVFEDTNSRMKDKPNIASRIIKGARNNTTLKNQFKMLVKDRKTREKNKKVPEILLQCNETRWLSVYRMLELFSHFRSEVTELFKFVKTQSKAKSESFNLEVSRIGEVVWTYLSFICNILKSFVELTMELQRDKIATSSVTLPYMGGIFNDIDSWKPHDLVVSNPLTVLDLMRLRRSLRYYHVRENDIEKIKDVFLATKLDPHFKTGVFKNVKSPRSVAISAEEYLHEVFIVIGKSPISKVSQMKKTGTAEDTARVQRENKCQSFYDEIQMCRGENDDVAELRSYLAQDRAQFDYKTRDYWQAHKTIFPTFYRMAKDYLYMMAMSAPSESLFSRVKCIVTDKRNRLLSETIKMLAILKSKGIVTDEISTLVDSLQDLALEKAKDPKESTPPETNFAQRSECQEEAEPLHTNTGENSGCVNESESIDLSIGQVLTNAGVFDSSNSMLVKDLGNASDSERSGPLIEQNSKNERDSESSNLRNSSIMSKLSSPIMSFMNGG